MGPYFKPIVSKRDTHNCKYENPEKEDASDTVYRFSNLMLLILDFNVITIPEPKIYEGQNNTNQRCIY
jgi:hypothetical protein